MKQIRVDETHKRMVRYDLDNPFVVVVPGQSPSWRYKRGTPSQRYRINGAFISHERYEEPKAFLRSERVKIDGERMNVDGHLHDWDIKAMSTEDQAALAEVLAMAKAQYRRDYPEAP